MQYHKLASKYNSEQAWNEYIEDLLKIVPSQIASDNHIKELNERSDILIDKAILVANYVYITNSPVFLHFHHHMKYVLEVKSYDPSAYRIKDFAYLYCIKENKIWGVLKHEVMNAEAETWTMFNN